MVSKTISGSDRCDSDQVFFWLLPSWKAIIERRKKIQTKIMKKLDEWCVCSLMSNWIRWPNNVHCWLVCSMIRIIIACASNVKYSLVASLCSQWLGIFDSIWERRRTSSMECLLGSFYKNSSRYAVRSVANWEYVIVRSIIFNFYVLCLNRCWYWNFCANIFAIATTPWRFFQQCLCYGGKFQYNFS